MKITILGSLESEDNGFALMVKQWVRKEDGTIVVKSYDQGFAFKAKEYHPRTISDLFRVIEKYRKKPTYCMIRGGLVEGSNPKRLRRCIGLQDGKYKGINGGFEAQPTKLVSLDFDGIPCEIDTNSDPEGAIKFLINKLPEEFHDVSCCWHFSGSHGAPGREGTIRAHVYFYTKKYYSDHQMKQWALAVNEDYQEEHGRALIDASLLNSVQAHYLGYPILDPGIADPVLRRSGYLTGSTDAVALQLRTPKGRAQEAAGAPLVRSGAERVSGGGFGFDALVSEIGGARGYRAPIFGCACSWFIAHGADAPAEPLVSEIWRHLLGIELARSKEVLAGYIADQMGDARRFAAEKLAERTVERIAPEVDFGEIEPGVALPPFYDGPVGEKAAGLAAMDRAIAGWFDTAAAEALSVSWGRGVWARLRPHTKASGWRAFASIMAAGGFPQLDGPQWAGFDDTPPPEQLVVKARRAAASAIWAARRRVRARITAAIGPTCERGARLQLSAPAGAGKTRSLARELLKRPLLIKHGVTWIMAPDLALAALR